MHVDKAKSKKENSNLTPTQILQYSPVFLINSIIERKETFENNFDSAVTVILKE